MKGTEKKKEKGNSGKKRRVGKGERKGGNWISREGDR